MFCSECGTRVETTAKFCANCGTKLSAPKPLVEETIPERPTEVRAEEEYDNGTVFGTATFVRSANENSSAWFKVGSPFEGQVISAVEFKKRNDQRLVEKGKLSKDEALEWAKKYEKDYEDSPDYSDDFIAIIPTSGIVKAPFDGTVTMDSSVDSIIICANNGVTVRILFGESCPDYDFESIGEFNVGYADEVKKGDTLFEFDLKKWPVGLATCVKIEKYYQNGTTFTILEKSKVSLGDTIVDVEGRSITNVLSHMLCMCE